MSMSDINTVVVSGRLVQDAKLFETEKGSQFCLFTIATNEYYTKKDAEEQSKNTAFVDCCSWSKAAVEGIDKLVKGAPLTVVGQLETYAPKSEEKTKVTRIKVLKITTD